MLCTNAYGLLLINSKQFCLYNVRLIMHLQSLGLLTANTELRNH